jgi:predicted GIY-YIG superfamily endonuclease
MLIETTNISTFDRIHKPCSNQFNPTPSKAWLKNDEGINKFYTYILKLNDGQFYVGHSRELRARLSEHKDNMVTSTKGKEPKLQYFEISETRETAMGREKELTDIYKKNPREIRRLIIDFQEDIKAIDFE